MKILLSLYLLAGAFNLCPATALGDLAGSMSAGTWAQLNATGLTSSLITDGGGFNILEYSNKMEWWSGGKKMMYTGSGHQTGTQRLIEYDEATNNWAQAATRSLGIHSYNSFAINENGWLYYLPINDNGPSQLQRWNRSSWSTLGSYGGGYASCIAIAYFPDRNEIWAAQGYGGASLHYFNLGTNAWTRKSGTFSWNYQNFMVYSPVARKVFTGCGGGDGGSSVNWYAIDADGNAARRADAPAAFICDKSIVVAAPGSDRVLAWHYPNKTMYAYNPGADAWSTVYSGSSQRPFSLNNGYGGFGMVAGSIPEYGVVMFACMNLQTWLYKPPASITGSEKTPHLAAPAITASPNPFSSRTDIRINGIAGAKAGIYDVAGRCMADLRLEGGQNAFVWDASRLPAGIYLLKVAGGRNTYTEKLMLNR